MMRPVPAVDLQQHIHRNLAVFRVFGDSFEVVVR
jgi:hypothetical protein